MPKKHPSIILYLELLEIRNVLSAPAFGIESGNTLVEILPEFKNPIDVSTTQINGVAPGTSIESLDFADDGTLYGLGLDFPQITSDPTVAQLYTVDTDTGSATPLGNPTPLNFTSFSGDLEIINDTPVIINEGVFYEVSSNGAINQSGTTNSGITAIGTNGNEVYGINSTTDTFVRFLEPFSAGQTEDIGSLSEDFGFLTSLDILGEGSDEVVGATNGNTLFTIDPVTGSATEVDTILDPNNDFLLGTSFVPQGSSSSDNLSFLFDGNSLNVDNTSTDTSEVSVSVIDNNLFVKSNSGQSFSPNQPLGDTLEINLSSSGGGQIMVVDEVVNGQTFNTDFSGAEDLRNVIFKSPGITSYFDASANTNEDIYLRYVIDSGTEPNNVITSPSGVNIIQLEEALSPSSTIFNVGSPDQKVALDFSHLPEGNGGVNVNLGSEGTIIGGYQNNDLHLADGSQVNNFDVLVGSPDNDVLIGNDRDNLIIGGGGNDIINGNGGDDQLNSGWDFSPDVDNVPNEPGSPFDKNDDLTQFGAQLEAFNNQEGVSQTGKDAFANFGIYGFGQGTTDFSSSFNTANNLNPPATNDLLNGGPGNDALFGFNNSRTTAIGGLGNDVFSSNENGGPNLVDGSEGEDTILYSTGDTGLGGPGNDVLTEARHNPERNDQTTFLFGEGGDDIINGGGGPDEIRGGPGNNTIGLVGSNDIVIGEDREDEISDITPDFDTFIDTFNSDGSSIFGDDLSDPFGG